MLFCLKFYDDRIPYVTRWLDKK